MKRIDERDLPEGQEEPYEGYYEPDSNEIKCDRYIKEVEAIDEKLKELESMNLTTTNKVLRGTTVTGGFGGVNHATPKTDHKLTAFKSADGAYKSGMWLTASFAKD